ncbi:sigma factor regulator FecR [Vallitalea longa]|uniref:Sigma factor regulator FecR n=1 Tax=Vallitalea longa TaxID=2936439 RepID=A0A9W5YIG1_9FIRM|nr:SIS domain-containing protein [Vallitalea longa]GKX31888.1 sigma factor regulator FecR [Vallitalea longa]
MEKKLGKYTIKEIFEQGDAFSGVIETLDEITETINKVFSEVNPDEVIFTGCGTSLYLAQTSASVFSKYNNITAKAVPCSELYLSPETYIKGDRCLVIPITRRSDTTEVKMAINKVRSKDNVKTLAVTCDENSKEYNDYYILSPKAGEHSIVMTKSFTSMIFINLILAFTVAGEKEMLNKLKEMPENYSKVIDGINDTCEQIIDDNKDLNLYITLGQGSLYGIANESMNKIKEMAISNSEAYYSLEYRHGPMALVDNKTLITQYITKECEELEATLIKEMKEYGAKIFIIGDKLTNETKKYADYYIELDCGYNADLITPLVAISGQLLGYYCAISKGLDLDSPRNLSQAIILK